MPSKKQSVAKPPDGTVFFIDRSLGIEPIRTVLINAGLFVEIHDDHFARDEEDRIWLRAVGERGHAFLELAGAVDAAHLSRGALRVARGAVARGEPVRATLDRAAAGRAEWGMVRADSG